MLQDKQDIKENHNNLLMINFCNKGNLLCRKLICNNSIYEEDKAIIHKINQQLLCPLSLWKQQDMYNSKETISFAFDLDSKVILNHKQNDIQNLKQSVDILKSKSYDKTSILLQFVSELHILVLPQLRMLDYYKTIGLYRFLTR
jgi:hypothetical protein